MNVSAPRIIFVENLEEENTFVFVLDFGRFQLLKNERTVESVPPADDESEDELFMTPCSTPPGSKISPSIYQSQPSPTAKTNTNQEAFTFSKIVINKDTGLENSLHSEIYDKYTINLTDMQVLICKNRECTLACTKTSSSFHLIDKFNISIQLERRIVDTSEPEYPAIKFFGNLHKIVAHVNEQKIAESFRILNGIKFDINEQTTLAELSPNDSLYGEEVYDDHNGANTNSTAVVFQFVIDQMILEVQSSEKSIAEVQIIGAKAGICKQNGEININMGVHGFLLVDAIQSFGHDFEILVASHRSFE